jgi:hypothetical protein
MKCDICLKEFDENLAKECETKKHNVCDECCINDCCDKCETIVIMRKQLTELREKLRWIPVKYDKNRPPEEVPLLVRMEHCFTGKIRYMVLIFGKFRKLGHEAYSCDIQECSGGHPEWHIQGDVLEQLDNGWDMLIAFPPCTYLCNSGVRWLFNSDGSWNTERAKKMEDAIEFFNKLGMSKIPKKCIENPIMHRYAKEKINICRSQIIQPWMFGHGETKATGLHIKSLPFLKSTNIVNGREHRIHRMSPGPDRQKNRSKTFPGIAKAMAEQWGRVTE